MVEGSAHVGLYSYIMVGASTAASKHRHYQQITENAKGETGKPVFTETIRTENDEYGCRTAEETDEDAPIVAVPSLLPARKRLELVKVSISVESLRH